MSQVKRNKNCIKDTCVICSSTYAYFAFCAEKAKSEYGTKWKANTKSMYNECNMI